MVTDRTYLVAGSLAPRLNETLPETATVLSTDLDADREMIHQTVLVNVAEIYFGISDSSIVTEIDRNGNTISPRKTFDLSNNCYLTESSWSWLVVSYITAEVNHYLSTCVPRMTVNDVVKSQAESEQQGFSLA